MSFSASLQRHLTGKSIAVKMLLLTLIISATLWWALDRIQLQDLRRAFLAEVERDLEKEATDDRRLFNLNVRAIHNATKLIVGQKTFLDYLKQLPLEPPSESAKPLIYHANRPPRWLPRTSVLRAFFNARYAMLVGQDGSVREIYHNAPPGGDELKLPDELIHPGPLVRKLSHSQSYMTTLGGGTAYVLSAETVTTRSSSATLLLVSPIDDAFLALVGNMQQHTTIMTLIDPYRGEVVASSDFHRIPSGTAVDDLKGDYLQTSKSFFDYGASDLVLEFATFHPTEEAERLSNLILEMNSRQRSILVAVLILSFLLLSVWWSRRIGLLALRVEKFSEIVLGVSLSRDKSGDELEELERDFRHLATEIEHSHEQLQQKVDEKGALVEQLHQRSESLEQSNRQLHDAQDELLRKGRLATLGQLTATVSHELRNPLGAMRPAIYIIRKRMKEGDSRLQEALELIDRNITRCDHIIDELLDFTRITDLELHAVRFDEWLESVIDEQSIPAGIQIVKEFLLKDIELTVDTHRLRRAIINVVENGCHAMLDDNGQVIDTEFSRLRIKTQAVDGRIEIIISDTGCGISDEVLEKIFEPLFSTKGFGVGLGMPTVQQIMVQHSGGIEIDSEQERGTTVTLWLPQEVTEMIDQGID